MAVEPNITNGKELTRIFWATPLKELIKKPAIVEQGVYMFGGLDENTNPTSDLYLIKPDTKAMAKILDKKTGEWIPGQRPEIKLFAQKL